ncbi:glucose-6-phosphate dehydrogenase [Sulfuriroseicoccus oceanibius]|uniref:Glucose-6-phosphate 1-dehydrogenase n=1 Tax=Sulfuriroseicoccus oceanibius TaxID=2707525 RepID=A0A6B3L244_9BACT|nr:glucose-6-phosphate dehydrogenase [Sulfuriroseicoccus oceanibius]QQL43776.1 glucose-6-phosphate dehydrogenase [Sulfuriroseicoccus oceanibius]
MTDNPFREEQVARNIAEQCTIVIFGATGDLTHRKLVPAIYNIAADGELPHGTRIVGFARRDKSDEQFRQELAEMNAKVSRQGHSDTLWDSYAENIHYHQSTFTDLDGYKSLAKRLDELEDAAGGPCNRLFYLASAPEFFDDILENLKEAGLNQARGDKWSRVIVEKPFGKDLATAKHLNEVVNATFEEKDTYRIDHYLGKETAQNIMVLRFANAIFEPLWNNQFIDHVQITCSEDLGMEGGRGGYYDTAGALRDMVQNHLLQLLSLVAMEPPVDLSADGVRDAKVNVLRSLRPMPTAEDVAANVVRGQYTAGSINGNSVPGYREEDRVNPQSMTEAYVALRLHIDNWRWEGVPFFVRVGKRLPKKSTEISIHFKKAPNVLFNRDNTSGRENVLVIRIQPDEGHSLRMVSKIPGATTRMESVKMDFRYATSFGKASPEAYERLLLDAMAGDATLFARRDEVENAWKFIDQIEHAWHQSDNPPPMAEFEAGSWGPAEADALLAEGGRTWRRL